MIQFITRHYVPVNTDDPMERAARRWWLEKNQTSYHESELTGDWNDVCDRNGALHEVRRMLDCLRAEGVIE
jgi:hypothetical protein